jgi:hypothetical protein
VAELDRQVAIGQGQDRAFKASLRTAENAARSFREEAVRLKSTLQQVRTQCANDIRKRDVQIQRLKTHATTQQRGLKSSSATATITITPPVAPSPFIPDGLTVDDPNYSLKQETTEFLTTLCEQISDENDNVIGLVKSTLTTLRALQGLPAPGENEAPEEERDNSGVGAVMLQTSYEALAAEMDDVLEHLRSLLTNPSFVPIEEVQSRDAEIAGLKDGLFKTEARWKDAIKLMESWRKRLLQGGTSIRIEELGLGIGLSDRNTLSSDVLNNLPQAPDSDSGDLQDREEELQDLMDSADEEEEEEQPLGIGLEPNGNVLNEVDYNSKTIKIEVPVKFHDDTITTNITTDNASSKVSRIPKPRSADGKAAAAPPSPGRIKRKLDAVSIEAEAARKKRAAPKVDEEKPKKRQVLSAKSKISSTRRNTRRRSTLSPLELERLMKGQAYVEADGK